MANIINGTDTGSGGLITTGDSSDELQIQTAETTAITVDSGQRTKFPTTIGVGGATPSTSGSGISFPATQSASSDANTLDDYEQGSWTPSLTASTTNPSVTYTAQVGNYTKIGNVVHVFGSLAASVVSGGSGFAEISGLPFTVKNTNAGGGVFAYYSNVTLAAGKTQLAIQPQQNTTRTLYGESGSGVGAFYVSIGGIGAAYDSVFQITYNI